VVADQLECIFWAEIPAKDRPALGDQLKADLASAWARGRAAFADVPLDPEPFVRHLARALIRMSDGAAISVLVADDLYIACACLAGVKGAANAFLERHRTVIRRAIDRAVPKRCGDEVEQAVLADILVGTATRAPQIGDYAGRAPLARWVEVVAQRAAIRWQRSERARANVAARASLEPRLADTPMDSALMRGRYLTAFEESLKEALRRAPKKDRAILQLHLVYEITVEKIGTMFGVSQSTASRRLAKARDGVLADLKSMLHQRLGITTAEIASLVGLLSSRLDLSISQFLKAGS
jgi:RNA polymerase sigma-70 factor (ECF subfamily)